MLGMVLTHGIAVVVCSLAISSIASANTRSNFGYSSDNYWQVQSQSACYRNLEYSQASGYFQKNPNQLGIDPVSWRHALIQPTVWTNGSQKTQGWTIGNNTNVGSAPVTAPQIFLQPGQWMNALTRGREWTGSSWVVRAGVWSGWCTEDF